MPTIFFTGFPGFLGSELLPRALSREDGADAVCLVQPKFAGLARSRAAAIEQARPHLAGRIRVVEGDITAPGLGMAPGSVRPGDVSEVYHLAAVYDLSVGLGPAMKVNVDGTRHVLNFAKECPGLTRFQYVSTCYVSGRYPGVFTEDHLEEGQAFNNFYEETKYLAEVEVQADMRKGLPASIYRPAIVVGDSATGATQKFDGPYFAMQWLMRQARLAIMPVVGDPTATEMNVVPRDFVIDSIAYLSGRPEAAGRVFNLADPDPLTVDEMLDVMGEATGRSIVRVPLPLSVAKTAIDRVPGVYRIMRIPASAIDYFVHPTRYGTERTQQALAGSGIRCPRFPEYVDRLVAFAKAHPEIGAAAMV